MANSRRWTSTLWLAGLLALAATGAGAQDTQPATAVPAAPEPTPAPSPTPAPPKPWVAGYKNGFTLQSETGDYVLKVRGYVHADGRFALSDSASAVTNQFLLRRVRPIAEGTVAQYFDFSVIPDFGGGTTVLQDAYLDVHFTNKFRVRVGKMKTPFGIERLQSAQSILFVERALPNNLVPNRDVGVQLHGELGGGVLGYQAGVFNGVADNGSADTDINDSKDLVGRIFLSPWKTKSTSPLRGLGFGVAGTTGTASGALRSYASVSQVAGFSYLTTVAANGDRKRISPQGYYNVGRFGILAEYVKAIEAVQKIAPGQATQTRELTHSGWSVTGSYLLTGEDSSYGVVKPKNFFVPSAHTWGALQLVARINQLKLDPDTFPVFADPTKSVREATAYGVGVNWIWNNNLKLLVDYEQTSFKGGAPAGADRADEKSVQTRLQISY